jgi:hypothetical protein
VEELRRLQGLRASTVANLERLVMRTERFELPNGKGEKLAATLDRRSGRQK